MKRYRTVTIGTSVIAPCYIELFGGLCLRQGERSIVRFRTYKTAALLAYLAFHPNKPHSREVLANLFWPEGADSRLSLRVALGSLRRQLEPPGTPYGSILIASRASVQLNSDALRTDVAEFEAALREAVASPVHERAPKLQRAVELYSGELLPGYYEEWIAPQRERLARAYQNALDHLSALPAPIVSTTPARPRLPLHYNRFFGRKRELQRLEQLLSSPTPARLITIIGPGGIGKTRLAVETAHRCSRVFDGGVWFVPLADITDARLIPDAVADSLGVVRSAQVEPMEQLVQTLSVRPALLVLDNLEHLLTGSDGADTRTWIHRLLSLVPTLTCLATSRQPVEIECEIQFPLSLLPTASLQPLSDPQALMQLPSIEMFVDRAQSVRPDFQLTPRNATSVALLCTQLEGLPLSIELAAAWAQTLTPTQMVEQLSSQALLVSRRKDRPPRHRSLTSAIAWSFQLLSPELRQFFSRLSVFSGGWTWEAAQDVCEERSPIAALEELRSRSMIVAEEVGDAMRYRLLETLRVYASSQLSDEERNRLSLRHAEFYLRLVEGTRTEWEGLTTEQENLRAALEWAGSEELGLRLAGALHRFWEVRGEATEGRRWLQRALTGSETVPDSVRSQALYSAATLAALQGDTEEARSLAEESWRLCDPTNDLHAAASISLLLSKICHALGEHEQAESLLVQSLQLSRKRGSEAELAAALSEQGHRHGLRGDYGPAETCLSESRALYEALGERHGLAQVIHEQAIIQQYRQDFVAAHGFYQQMLTLCQALGDRMGISEALFGIGYIARLRSDYAVASSTLEQCLSLKRQMVLKKGVAFCLRNLGCVARDQGDYTRAMVFLEEALETARACGESQLVAEILGSTGVVALFCENYEEARRLNEECLQFRRTNGYKQDIGESLLCMALIALVENSLELAYSLLLEALELYQQVGSPVGISKSKCTLAHLSLQQGKLAEAEEWIRMALGHLKGSLVLRETTEELEQLARVVHARQDSIGATCLLGAAEVLRQQMGFQRLPYYQSLFEQQVQVLRTELIESQFVSAWSYGSTMTLNQAFEFALTLVSGSGATRLQAGG